VTGKKLVKTTLVEGGGGQVKETKKEARVKTFQLRTSGHRKLVTLSQFKTPVHAVTD
jgi:hypothetical protein